MIALLNKRTPSFSTFKVIKENLKVICDRSIKPISFTLANSIKTIVEKQEGKTMVVEGVISSSPRENLLVKPESNSDNSACPLCRLNLDVKHTDVLILSQFVRQDGAMLPRRITGLCKLQQKRVGYMVTMAHKAGLMGKFKPATCTLDPRNRPMWKKWNTYFDETTIKPPKKYVALRYKNKIEEFKKNHLNNDKTVEA